MSYKQPSFNLNHCYFKNNQSDNPVDVALFSDQSDQAHPEPHFNESNDLLMSECHLDRHSRSNQDPYLLQTLQKQSAGFLDEARELDV